MGAQLTGAVVGLHMGRAHLRAMLDHPDIELVALCDLDPQARAAAQAEAVAAGCQPGAFADYAAMLIAARPDIVAVATPNRIHAAMTIQAVEAGVRAVCCEKPMALDLGQARRMVAVCRDAGVPLVVNHQRRLGSDFTWLREQIADGAVGEVELIRGSCAGDMLSDGTHLIDSALFLAGDPEWSWVFGGWHRDECDGDAERGGGFHAVGGWRFGHAVETGMVTVCQLSAGPRVELFTGDMRLFDRPYHDIEVIGSHGTLRRAGDEPAQNLFRRAAGGEWEAVSAPAGGGVSRAIPESYHRLVALLRDGRPDTDHPLGASNALRGFELLMGALEAGRTASVVRPPVSQERYPLAMERQHEG
jgi:predicted dehydrogenase